MPRVPTVAEEEKRGRTFEREKGMKYVLIGDEGGLLPSGCWGSDAAQIT